MHQLRWHRRLHRSGSDDSGNGNQKKFEKMEKQSEIA
jgi:hypothetical protein